MTEKKYTEKYWQEELRRSEQDSDDKFFGKSAEESIKVYESEKSLEDNGRKLNIWWAVIQTVMPAYYAQPPKVEVTLRKKQGTDIIVKSAVAAERATQYAIDEYMRFDEVANLSLLDYLLTGHGVIRVMYDADVGQNFVEYPLFADDNEGYVDAYGKPWNGDAATLKVSDDGSVQVREPSQVLEGQRAYLARLHWRDFRAQVGRMPSEIGWKAHRAYMSRAEVEKKFGKKFAENLKFETFPEDVKKGKTTNVYEGKAELWEIWCKDSGKTYWFSGAGIKTVLEPSDPPLYFTDFYPFEELAQNTRLNSSVPLSDYALLRDQILEVERTTTRIHSLLQAHRTNGVYDAALGDTPQKLFQGDLNLYPVKFPGYKGEQVLARSIEFMPLEALSNSLKVLVDAREMALSKIYEQTGAADIVRGAADPTMTATQAMTENSRANWRFGFRKRQVNEWYGRAIAKLGETICTQFTPELLFEISSAENIVGLDPTGQPDQQEWAAICALLKKEPGRRYKIAIATDSMNAVDEAQEHKDRTELIQSAGSFMGQMDQLIQQHPSIGPFAMKMMQYVCRSYRGGKDLEGDFKTAIQSMQQEAQARASQPPEGAADAQVKIQIAQLQQQTEQAKIQSEQAITALVENNKKAIADLNAQVEMWKVQAQSVATNNKATLDAQVNQLKAEHQASIEKIQQDADTTVATLNAAIAKDKADAEMRIKTVESAFKMEIEKQKMEAQALKGHVDLVKSIVEMKRGAEEKEEKRSEAPQAPAIHVHIPKAGKRTGTIQDSKGAIKTITVEDSD